MSESERIENEFFRKSSIQANKAPLKGGRKGEKNARKRALEREGEKANRRLSPSSFIAVDGHLFFEHREGPLAPRTRTRAAGHSQQSSDLGWKQFRFDSFVREGGSRSKSKQRGQSNRLRGVGEVKPEFNGDSVETARGIPVRTRKSAAAGEARLEDDDDIQSQQQQQQAAASENRTIRQKDSANKFA